MIHKNNLILFSSVALIALMIYMSLNKLSAYVLWDKLCSYFTYTSTIPNTNFDEGSTISNSSTNQEHINNNYQPQNDGSDIDNITSMSNIIKIVERNINTAISDKSGYILVNKNVIINYMTLVSNVSKIVIKFIMDIDYSAELNLFTSTNKNLPAEINHIIAQLGKYNEDYLITGQSVNNQELRDLSTFDDGADHIFKIKKYHYNLKQKNSDRRQIIRQLDTLQSYFYDSALLNKYIDE